MHVQCWQETYVGLLPTAEIARRNMTYRQNLWSKMITAGDTHIRMIDNVGFAQMGPQRDEVLKPNYPRELYALYTLRSAYGSGAGQLLLHDVANCSAGGFSALVLKGNARAMAFYRKVGGRFLKEVVDTVGYTDVAFGWTVPIQLQR